MSEKLSRNYAEELQAIRRVEQYLIDEEDKAALKAGRELDAEIAEKVMGWTRKGPVFRYYDNDAGFLDREGKRRRAPYYSTDISAAWEVVEKVRASGRVVSIFIDSDTDPDWWSIEFSGLVPGGAVCDRAKNVAEGICLAALRAVGS